MVVLLLLLLLRVLLRMMAVLRHVGRRLVEVMAGRYDRQTVVGRVIAVDAPAADGLLLLLMAVMTAAVVQLLLAVVREHFVGSGAHAVRVARTSGADDRRPIVVGSHVSASGRGPAAAVI